MKKYLVLLLVCSQTFAQSTAEVNTSQAEVETSIWKGIKERTRISYFSETLGPSIQKLDDNERNDDGTIADDPTTMYHSFSLRFKMNSWFDLYMSPRFSTVFGNRDDLPDYWDKQALRMDDWQFGFYTNIVKTKNFQYRQRLTHRAPFSKKSKDEHIESQVEWQHDFTYSVNPAFRIIHWNNYRYYAYNSQSSSERYRVNFTSLFNYTLTDTWLVQFMHELDLQHKNPKDKDASGHRELNHMKPYHHYYSFGVGYSPIKQLTFIPFLRMTDGLALRNETTVVGLTILGSVL